MARLFIVGDIHACPAELEALLSALALEAKDHLVFLGDYIDRGPGAREVIDLLLALRAAQVCGLTFLRGNHEDMFLDFLGYGGGYGEAFLMNGGIQTLDSYGCWPDVTALPARIPETHIAFLRGSELSFSGREPAHDLGHDILCVHAGIDPQRPLADQRVEHLLWIRHEFIDKPHSLPYTIIYGHTPQPELRFHLPYKVGIDTGLVYGGRLSCLEWTTKTVYQVAKGSRQVRVVDVGRQWSGGG